MIRMIETLHSDVLDDVTAHTAQHMMRSITTAMMTPAASQSWFNLCLIDDDLRALFLSYALIGAMEDFKLKERESNGEIRNQRPIQRFDRTV